MRPTLNSPYEAILERISGLHPNSVDLSLSRIKRLLRVMGNPERELPPVVHIAGTNGKGSTIAYLRAFLESAGYRVNVFTSPHLTRFNERIRLDGEVIDDDLLVAVLEQCEKANNGEAITYFEITTAAAFLAFRRRAADVVLLETGLGGRLDATNMIDRPLLTALTPISMDHQHFLGETLALIAGEKAGIMKDGVTCVCARQQADGDDVIASRARALAAPLFVEGRDWKVRATPGGFIFDDGERRREFPRPGLIGAHQIQNAGLAIACVDRMTNFKVNDTAIAEGLAGVEWPGRLQRLEHGPLVECLPEGWELWIDGGHNQSAGVALAAHARQWLDMPLHMIVGMVEGKDRRGFLRPLAAVKRLRAVPIVSHENASTTEDIARTASELGFDAKPCQSVNEAIAEIAGATKKPSRILITGSLYLVGEVLEKNG